jgi:hypothetical protein
MGLVSSSFMNQSSLAAIVPYRRTTFLERADMQYQNKRWFFLLLGIFICGAFTCGQGHAQIATDHIFLLTPDHDTATKDYISYSPSDSLKEMKYFLVVFTGYQTAIETFTIKLSSAPLLKAYTGSVTYSLLAAGYPTMYCAKVETATNSTVASNNIKAAFPVNAQFGFAIIAAAVLSRHDVDSDVKMSIRFEIQ